MQVFVLNFVVTFVQEIMTNYEMLKFSTFVIKPIRPSCVEVKETDGFTGIK
jgi:hypothetical protein